MSPFSKLDRFHKTRRGYFLFGVIELIGAYIFAAIAFDTANMWAYVAAIILLIGAVLNIINVFTSPKDKKGKGNARGRS